MDKLQISLKAARVNMGLTLSQVSSITNKSIDTIMKYEHDSSNIPRELLIKLLSIYAVHQDDVFFGKQSDFIRLRKETLKCN